MPHTDLERRHPRVTISDLRRDLRDADRTLFALHARRDEVVAARPRGRAVVFSLILVLPIASAVYGLSISRPPRADRVQVAVAPVDTVSTIDAPAALAPAPVADTTDIGRSTHARTPRPSIARARSAANAVRTRPRPVAASAASVPRPHVPRPLSPGEFGRRADSH